jgi:hypothetical protein
MQVLIALNSGRVTTVLPKMRHAELYARYILDPCGQLAGDSEPVHGDFDRKKTPASFC